MERTISGMMGKGSVNHNTRAFSAKNVDKERSRDNVEFCHKDIKAVYHELFDEALERYNAKHRRCRSPFPDNTGNPAYSGPAGRWPAALTPH